MRLYVSGIVALILLPSIYILGCQHNNSKAQLENKSMQNNQTAKLDTATFGSGCFWCTEAIFERVNGVQSVVSGYSGGSTNNPSYEEVCSGNTGHAEVCQITYNPDIVSYDELLEIFWKTHNPTTLNRQGADVGTQYRSVIFYHNEEQKKLAEYYKNKLNESGAWKDTIVTQIVPFVKFFKGENYYQNYFENNPSHGYCSFVIAPKVEKFEKIFKKKLKHK